VLRPTTSKCVEAVLLVRSQDDAAADDQQVKLLLEFGLTPLRTPFDIPSNRYTGENRLLGAQIKIIDRTPLEPLLQKCKCIVRHFRLNGGRIDMVRCFGDGRPAKRQEPFMFQHGVLVENIQSNLLSRSRDEFVNSEEQGECNCDDGFPNTSYSRAIEACCGFLVQEANNDVEPGKLQSHRLDTPFTFKNLSIAQRGHKI